MKTLLCLFLTFAFFSCQPRNNNPIDYTNPRDNENSEELELVWKVERERKFHPAGANPSFQVCNIKFDGEYFYICSDFALRKYKKADGEMIWEFQLFPVHGTVRGNFWQMTDMILENGKIFLISGKMVHCVSSETGMAFWNLDLNPFHTALSQGEHCHSNEYIFISDRGAKHQAEVLAVSKQTGTVVWRNNDFAERKDLLAKKSVSIGPPAYSKYNDRVYVSGYYNEEQNRGVIFCIDAKTGQAITEVLSPNFIAGELEGYDSICSGGWSPKSPTGAPVELQIFEGGILVNDIMNARYSFDLALISRKFASHNSICNSARSMINPRIVDDVFVYYGYGAYHGLGFGCDVNTMEQIWSIGLDETSRAGGHTLNSNPIFVDKDKAYIVTDDGWLFGNDPKTGELLISASLSGQTFEDENGDKHRTGYLGPYGVDGDYIYYVGKHIYCYKRKQE